MYNLAVEYSNTIGFERQISRLDVKKERRIYMVKIKKAVALTLAILMLSAVMATAVSAGGQDFPADSSPVNVTLDGKRVLEGQAAIINSVTYVPVRAFSVLMGAESISWNQSTRTATVKKNGVEMHFTSNALYVGANGRYFFTVQKILNLNGTLYVPVRAIAQAFSVNVDWNAASRTVILKSTGKTLVSGSKFYNSTDLYWLSRIISAEASGESLSGQIAVGNVVLNRKASKQYPNTVYGVIFDRVGGTQFSPVSMGTIYNAPTQSSIIAAKICLEGYSVDTQILFFMNPRIATSNWISKNRPFAFSLGLHDFYY